MKKLLLGVATIVTSLGLVSGASATSGGSIDTTGPGSRATITSSQRTNTRVDNDNSVRVRNHNSQRASSGDAKVWRNTTGGNATSGYAANENSFRLKATVDNNTAATVAAAQGAGGSGALEDGGSISNTGPDSHAKIESKVSNNTSVRNTNHISVSNSNQQSAYSGDATVSNNTTGGDATSGDATNTNSTSITLNVTN